MSLEKAILLGKEKRKPYPTKDSRNFDWSCRHGGSCTYCSENRQFSSKRRQPVEYADPISGDEIIYENVEIVVDSTEEHY